MPSVNIRCYCIICLIDSLPTLLSVKKHQLIGLGDVEGEVLQLHLLLGLLHLIQVLQENDAAVTKSSDLNVVLTAPVVDVN